MYACELEHLFSYSATLQAPAELIGPVAEGYRANFYVTGGRIEGPRLKGRVRPVGADFFLLRPDSMGELQVRATFEADDGALIDVAYTGLTDFGADGYAKVLRGEWPRKVALRTQPRLRSAHPDYQWLQRRLCLAVGEADLERYVVGYDVYAVR